MISYLLEVSICWLGFYLIYVLLLSKETFFSANRIYLLGSLLLGLTLPLVDYLPTNWFHYEEEGLATVYLQPIHVGVQQIEEMVYVAAEESNNTITNWLIGIYIAGVVFFLSRFSYGFRQIYRLYKNGKIIQKEDHVLVLTQTVHYPFSFFNHLFWSEAIAFKTENDERIISHEKAHIDGKHSVDVLCVELLCVLFWCSPMIYFYKKSIRVIHEYLADALVLETTHKKQYGQLLLRQSQSGLQVALANNFFHSQLKKRIAMMTKNKSTHRSKVKYLLVVPMLLLLITLLTQKDLIAQINESSLNLFSESATENTDDEIYQLDVPLSSLTEVEFTVEEMKALGIEIKKDTVPTRPQVAIEGEIFKVVEEMPRFPGCEEKGGSKEDISKCAAKEMLMFIYKNIKYPSVAREAGIQGTIVVTFVVDTEGNVVNPEILRSIGGGCDEEVMRIVGEMPQWRPGIQRGKAVNVQYNLPVNYKIEGDDVGEKCEDCPEVVEQLNGLKGKTLDEIVVVGYGADKKLKGKIGSNAKDDKNQKAPSLQFDLYDKDQYDKPKPIVYVNDKLYSGDMNKLNTDNIAEIHVLKGEKAIEYAGKNGKNGVILVTLKENSDKTKNLKKPKPVLYVNGSFLNAVYIDKINPAHIEKVEVLKGKEATDFAGKDRGKHGVVLVTLKENIYMIQADKLSYETKKVTMDDGSERIMQVKIDPTKEKYWTRMRTSGKSTQNMNGNTPPPIPPPPPSFQDFLEDEKLSKVLILIDGKEATRAEVKKRKDELRMITYSIPDNSKAIAKYGDKAKDGVVRFVTVTKPEVFKVVEEMPRFPGCDDMAGSAAEKKACADQKMLEFIYENIQYPEGARKNKIEGMVVISFIVNEDGTLSDSRILRNIGAKTGEEALRVVDLMNEMPKKWTPGKQRGKKVKVQFNLPVRFKLTDEVKKEGTVVKENKVVNFSLRLEEFKAFPNPTEGKLNVSFESSQSPIVVSITDIAGKEVFRESVNNFDGFYNKNIDVSDAAKGTLILNIIQDDKVFSSKVLHQ